MRLFQQTESALERAFLFRVKLYFHGRRVDDEIESRIEWIVELLSKMCRAQSDEPDDEPLNEQEVSFARHARTLIDRISRLPEWQCITRSMQNARMTRRIA